MGTAGLLSSSLVRALGASAQVREPQRHEELEQTVVPTYPVKVNSAPPPQEPGTPRRPGGRVACAT